MNPEPVRAVFSLLPRYGALNFDAARQNPRRRVRGPGLHVLVGRVPSRGVMCDSVYRASFMTVLTTQKSLLRRPVKLTALHFSAAELGSYGG